MPPKRTYPGAYVQEVPSGVRTITGVATSITAFVGRALRGPADEPTRIHSFGDFNRIFGGLWSESTMSYAVEQFFMDGGTNAIIVRVVHTNDAIAAKNATKALATVGGLVLNAANEGDWGNHLKAVVDHQTDDPANYKLFNLTIQELTGADTAAEVVDSEVLQNISTDPTSSRYVAGVLKNHSDLVRVPDGAIVPESRAWPSRRHVHRRPEWRPARAGRI